MSKWKTPDPIEAQLRGRFIQSGLFSFDELSRHRGILNLLERESGLVWSLIADRENMTAFSLLVPELFDGDGEAKSNPCSAFSTEEEKLNLAGTLISYKNCPSWKGAATSLRDNSRNRNREFAIIRDILEKGDSFLSLLADEDGDETIFQRKARDITNHCISGKDRILRGLEKLVGLGQGLTPAGDDFLTGVLLAGECGICPFQTDKQEIGERLEKTTAPGRTMLYAALRGSFPAYILKYAETIKTTDSDNKILSAVHAAAGHGSTSGRDCLAGFYWAFSLYSSI
ncbi:MAG: DUF2877 domain-containing protein [Spirochaetales bacterium]|nr:DUF2877 domain-containing protein [Spirochaetales bacterium]